MDCPFLAALVRWRPSFEHLGSALVLCLHDKVPGFGRVMVQLFSSVVALLHACCCHRLHWLVGWSRTCTVSEA